MGLLPHSTSSTVPSSLQPNDKFLHFITFFVLSVTFYWIPDTSRRRAIQASLLFCTLGLGIGSEIVQALLPNDRLFDPFDIVANVVGSAGAIALCGWYHRRMLERRRAARFGSISDDVGGAELGNGDDIELGLSTNNMGPQETGVVTTTTTTTTTNLEHEVDNWDENAVDTWDTEDGPGPAEETIENGNVKTRND
jgi:VanZ family protein